MRSPLTRRLLGLLFTLFVLAPTAAATWSIVVVNAVTGEVAVGTATCLTNLNLRHSVPVIVVGKGAAAAQSLLDLSAVNRTKIEQAFLAGVQTPTEILEELKKEASFNLRQYGIVSMNGAPVTFTGKQAGAAASGVTGSVGDYVYAIQGNLLTGDEVVMAAEAAFVSTNGDLAERMMASMQAARAMGGDGRCSCAPNNATGCGAPPANFTKSAHIGTMIVARVGDEDKTCNATKGCARGTYYMLLNVANARAGDPDPVEQLQGKYDAWRLKWIDRADAVHSRVSSVQALPADGTTQRTVTVSLRDIDDVPLTGGGAILSITTADGQPALTTVGPVTDHGDGTYSFSLTAGTAPGTDTYAIEVDGGFAKTTTLYPYLSVRSDPVAPLHVGYDDVSAAVNPSVPFVVDVPSHPGARYALAASLNGTQPGTMLGDLALPLNMPVLSALTPNADESLLGSTFGVLDAAGRAEPSFQAGPLQMAALIGRRVDWAVVVGGGPGRAGPLVVGPVGYDIVP